MAEGFFYGSFIPSGSQIIIEIPPECFRETRRGSLAHRDPQRVRGKSAIITFTFTTMKLYFAYGSNMWDAQMRRRCPESRKIGVARLPQHRWIISTRGYANVVTSQEDVVEGVLFELSESDEKELDLCEGVASGSYAKFHLSVIHEGRELLALVYIDPITTEGVPKGEYIHRINSGIVDAGLSQEYISRHLRRFIPESSEAVTHSKKPT